MNKLPVRISPEVDATISQLLPENASGEHDLPSQHQFVTEALPLIIEQFSLSFHAMRMPIDNRPDIRIANFEDLLVPLATVTAALVYNMTYVDRDYILLTKLTIEPYRTVYEE